MELSMKDILLILWRRWWVIILGIIFGAVFAFTISKVFIKPSYVSEIRMYVNADKSNSAANLQNLSTSQKLISTYIVILEDTTFLQKVAEHTALNYTKYEIASMLSMSSVNDTEVLSIKVSSHIPQHSATIARAISELGPPTITDIVNAGSVKLIKQAEVPLSPSSPNITLNSTIGALLGAFLVFIIFLLIEIFDVRIKGEEDLTKQYNFPVIGIIQSVEQ